MYSWRFEHVQNLLNNTSNTRDNLMVAYLNGPVYEYLETLDKSSSSSFTIVYGDKNVVRTYFKYHHITRDVSLEAFMQRKYIGRVYEII